MIHKFIDVRASAATLSGRIPYDGKPLMMSAVSRKREPSAGLQHNKIRELRATRPLCEILRAHQNIISQIHLAEAKVFANCGVLTQGNPACTISNLETIN